MSHETPPPEDSGYPLSRLVSGVFGRPNGSTQRFVVYTTAVDAGEVERLVEVREGSYEAPLYWVKPSENPPETTWMWLHYTDPEVPGPLNAPKVEAETTLRLDLRYAGPRRLESKCGGDRALPFAVTARTDDGAINGEFLVVVDATPEGPDVPREPDRIGLASPSRVIEEGDPVPDAGLDWGEILVEPEFEHLPLRSEYFANAGIVEHEAESGLGSGLSVLHDKPRGTLLFADDRMAVFPTPCGGLVIDEQKTRSKVAATIDALPEFSSIAPFEGLVSVKLDSVPAPSPCAPDPSTTLTTALLTLSLGDVHLEQELVVTIDDKVSATPYTCLTVDNEALLSKLGNAAVQEYQNRYERCDYSCESTREVLTDLKAALKEGLRSLDYCVEDLNWFDGKLGKEQLFNFHTEHTSVLKVTTSLFEFGAD